jgi:hypothetical protein
MESHGWTFSAIERGQVRGKYAGGSAIGIGSALDFAAGPAPGAGVIRPAGVPRGMGTAKHPFTGQIVDNLLNNTVSVQANLVPANA